MFIRIMLSGIVGIPLIFSPCAYAGDLGFGGNTAASNRLAVNTNENHFGEGGKAARPFRRCRNWGCQHHHPFSEH
jgi:hypothetical protein